MILVTGGNGFVGSAVVRKLLAGDRPVRVICRPGSDRHNLTDLDVEIVEGDLRDPASLALAVSGCEQVFHIAADYRLWVRDPDTLYQSNVTGSLNLLDSAVNAGVGRIVYTSSVATLGIHADRSPANEDSPVSLVDMIGHYKRSKYIAEDQIRRGIVEKQWPVVIVNPSTPIGPRDIKPTPTGRMILDAARGKIPAFVDTGLNVVHVDDVADGHLLAMQNGQVGERYILGGEDMSLETILGQVATITGRKPPAFKLPHAVVMPIAVVAELICRLTGTGEPLATVDGVRMARKHMYFCSDKARHELGYRSRPATEALTDAVNWFREEGRLGSGG